MSDARPLLALIGAKGMLAGMVRRLAEPRYRLALLDLPEFDLTDPAQVSATLAPLRPSVIVNCAAITDVDGCESREALAAAVNGAGPGHLAAAAKETDATLVHLSTDYVFDGTASAPYREDDPPNPRSAYGRSKLLGEERIAASGLGRAFVVRTSWLYGPGGKNFVETIARLAAEREELRVVADQLGTPTYTADLADALLRLVACEEGAGGPAAYGTYHYSGEGACTWHAFAEAVVEELRARGAPVRVRRVEPIRTEEYPLPAPRPAYSVLSKEKFRRATGAAVPPWRQSLSAYFDHRGA